MFKIIILFLLIIIFILLIIRFTKKDDFYNISNINYKTQYFNNRGLAQLCNKKLDIIPSDTDSNFDKKYFENLNDGDTIFLTTNMFKKFINQINLQKKVIIILGCSVSGFPNEFSKNDKINYQKYIENNNNILKLFTQNYDLNKEHNKIKPLPLGIDYHSPSNKQSPIEQEINY